MTDSEMARRRTEPASPDSASARPGEYGGAGSGEGQGEYAGDGYSAMGDFAGSSRDPDPELNETQRREVEEERATRPDLGWQNRPPAPSAETEL